MFMTQQNIYEKNASKKRKEKRFKAGGGKRTHRLKGSKKE